MTEILTQAAIDPVQTAHVLVDVPLARHRTLPHIENMERPVILDAPCEVRPLFASLEDRVSDLKLFDAGDDKVNPLELELHVGPRHIRFNTGHVDDGTVLRRRDMHKQGHLNLTHVPGGRDVRLNRCAA